MGYEQCYPCKGDFSEDCMESVKSVFMHSEFLVDQNWLISVLINLVNHQITQLNAKKN